MIFAERNEAGAPGQGGQDLQRSWDIQLKGPVLNPQAETLAGNSGPGLMSSIKMATLNRQRTRQLTHLLVKMV
jgi:hypothetical protein